MGILNKISVESKMYWDYPKEWLEKWLDDLALTEKSFQNQNIYKLEESNSIIGFCSIKENETEYEIMHLWIKPEYIGKGYGKHLLNETIKRVVKKREGDNC
jgi:ribosomal protein S18 acetylase RimI-like enzyme